MGRPGKLDSRSHLFELLKLKNMRCCGLANGGCPCEQGKGIFCVLHGYQAMFVQLHHAKAMVEIQEGNYDKACETNLLEAIRLNVRSNYEASGPRGKAAISAAKSQFTAWVAEDRRNFKKDGSALSTNVPVMKLMKQKALQYPGKSWLHFHNLKDSPHFLFSHLCLIMHAEGNVLRALGLIDDQGGIVNMPASAPPSPGPAALPVQQDMFQIPDLNFGLPSASPSGLQASPMRYQAPGVLQSIFNSPMMHPLFQSPRRSPLQSPHRMSFYGGGLGRGGDGGLVVEEIGGDAAASTSIGAVCGGGAAGQIIGQVEEASGLGSQLPAGSFGFSFPSKSWGSFDLGLINSQNVSPGVVSRYLSAASPNQIQ